MSSCFFSLLFVAFVLAKRNLHGLAVELDVPSPVFVGENLVIRAKLEDVFFRSHSLIGIGDKYFRSIGIKQNFCLRFNKLAEKRGKFILKDFEIFSFFPINIFYISANLPVKNFWVAPAPAKVHSEKLLGGIGSGIELNSHDKEGDYWMQKQYSPGEDASLINWSLSAKSNFEWVLVKKLQRGISCNVRFSLEALPLEDFEKALQLITAWVLLAFETQSDCWVWASDGQQYRWFEVHKELEQILIWLAEIDFDENIPAAEGDFYDCNPIESFGGGL